MNASHLLLIGAYRSNEVDAHHPLVKTIAEVRRLAPEHVTEIALKPLQATHIAQLLCDSFRCDAAEAQPLAQLLVRKTSGNPFFCKSGTTTCGSVRTFESEHGCGRW